MTIAPEKITIKYRNGKVEFSAWGALDTTQNWQGDYVRRDLAERSQATHNHQFAEIKQLYDTLPEWYQKEAWACNADTFRKRGLIMTDQCDVMEFFYPTAKDALKLAPTQKDILFKHHGYVVGSGAPVDGGFLVAFKVPHSQSTSVMGREAFQQSKEKVLQWAKDLLKIDQELLIGASA